MSFSRGTIITATELNNTNGAISKTYAEGHAGWSYATKYYHFYCTKPSGRIVNYTSSRAAGCWHSCKLERYENGGWVQKDYSSGSGAIKADYYSVGMGAYRVTLYYHNNTPTTRIYPAKTDNARGKLLCMTSDNLVGLSDAEVKAVNNRYHGQLTTDALNNGRVYTE